MEIAALLASGIVPFDGGFGSLAAARGLSFDCAEALSLSHPADVRAIHRAYVEAGARVIETNTLGANPVRLAAHGLDADVERITARAISLAREAGAETVACSMGTTAEFLAPYGTLTLEDAVQGFVRQARAAREAGADMLFTETLTDLAEARAMWMAARAAGLPFGASFTFLPNGRTLTGSPPEICALTAEAMGASLVGVNCVGDPALLLRCIRAMRAVSRVPLIAQPNAGFPEQRAGGLHYPMTPGALLALCREAVESGVSAVGGCCGTTPEHVRPLAEQLGGMPAPALGGDGIPRVCSLRECLPLADALRGAVLLSPDSTDDAEDAPALMLDLRGCAPSAAIEFVAEVSLLHKQPLLFTGNDPQALNAALRAYPGIAAVDGPSDAALGAHAL